MYRLLALDLDGTLLRADHSVDPRDVAAIAELQAAGVAVTIVTGRLHSGSTEAALVRAAGPHKGTALAELCRLAGCTTDEAVVVGDWINDVPMFQAAGRSFVMGNAPDDVRAAASDQLVTPAGAGGGIAEAVRRAFG